MSWVMPDSFRPARYRPSHMSHICNFGSSQNLAVTKLKRPIVLMRLISTLSEVTFEPSNWKLLQRSAST